jgi:parvulin-like peptidyl-prolyl isomerase
VSRLLLIMLALAVLGCSSSKEESKTQKASDTKTAPDYVTVQHILIGFSGSVPGKGIRRTREEAEAMAQDVLRRAQAGEDFDTLVKEYTDDSPPGIYSMANNGVSPRPGERMFQRSGMVKSFGDVAFSLDVGEIGMAPFDAKDSPFGWHIIKRLK